MHREIHRLGQHVLFLLFRHDFCLHYSKHDMVQLELSMEELFSAGANVSFSSLCAIAVFFGVALIALISIVAAFCCSEENNEEKKR